MGPAAWWTVESRSESRSVVVCRWLTGGGGGAWVRLECERNHLCSGYVLGLFWDGVHVILEETPMRREKREA